MTEHAFDASAWNEAMHEAFAPAHKVQREGLKALERFARFQYAVAGDYLQSGLAQAQAALSSRNAAEFVSKQAELGTLFGQRISARAQELANLASETQSNYFSDLASEAPSRATHSDDPAGRASGARARQRGRRAR